MPARKSLIAELTAPEVAERLAAGAAVLLPMASTETHGPAAPMGDFLLTEEIARRIAEAAMAAGTDALVAPTLPYGGEDFFTDTPGCIALTTKVLQAVIEEMAGNLLRHGTRRLLIVNGHGGSIPAIEDASRALRRRHGVLIPTLHLWRTATALHGELGGTPDRLGHGGDPVWSVLLHLRPDLARPDRLRAGKKAPPALGLPVSGFGLVRCGGVEFSLPLSIEEIAPGGVAAPDAKGGSAEFGAALVQRLVAAGVAMLEQLKREG
jgi:creatinine amidohydrolase